MIDVVDPCRPMKATPTTILAGLPFTALIPVLRTGIQFPCLTSWLGICIEPTRGMDTIMHELTTSTVREIALAVPATTRVFEEFKIDYCCGGRRLLDDACRTAGVKTEVVLNSLTEVMTKGDSIDIVPEAMGPSALIDYILARHHIFTAKELARLEPLMEKVVTRHGEHHLELAELKAVFTMLVESLAPHMRKEENVLFPYIQSLERSRDLGTPAPVPHFGTVKNPIRMMMADHDADGDRL